MFLCMCVWLLEFIDKKGGLNEGGGGGCVGDKHYDC